MPSAFRRMERTTEILTNEVSIISPNGANAKTPITMIKTTGFAVPSLVFVGCSLTAWAKLVEIEDKQLRDMKDFSTVLKDSCENPTAQNREIKAALIKYDSQNASQIVSSYYRAACPAKKDGKLYPDIFKLTSDKSIEQKR